VRKPIKRKVPSSVKIVSTVEFDSMIGVRFETSDDDYANCHVHETDRDTIVVSSGLVVLEAKQIDSRTVYIKLRRG
jgi:hypothetical protein